jgi:hypothetical protein
MEAMIDPNKRLVDVTLGELLEFFGKTPTVVADNTPKEKRLVYGIAGIARLFNCSMTTANRIKASGKIERAVSQLGRTIIVDADLALELMKDSKQ